MKGVDGTGRSHDDDNRPQEHRVRREAQGQEIRCQRRQDHLDGNEVQRLAGIVLEVGKVDEVADGDEGYPGADVDQGLENRRPRSGPGDAGGV